jgi:adenosine deaminase
MRPPLWSFACLSLSFAATLLSQSSTTPNTGSPATSQGPEARAARAYEAAVKQGPAALRAFLVPFPKGADLHVHLSGAVYAETFVRDAAEDGVCVDTVALTFANPPCTGNLIPATQLTGDIDRQHQLIYDKLIDGLSLRSFVPTAGWSTHDQFFSVFDRIDPLKDHSAEWVNELATRAAAQNEQYLELMQVPPFGDAIQIASQIGWNPQLAQADPQAFAQFRQQLLDHGLRDEVSTDTAQMRNAEAERKQMEHCGTAQAAPACQVEIRYIWTVLRDFAPERVFALILLGFETVDASIAAKDNLWVGINLVRPEDDFIAMRDYTLQMKIVSYLHLIYPNVHIALHAGELTLGLVPPEGLRFHIRQAVELGDAERVGHGVDVMYEDDAEGLLKEMAAKHVMVEINLTSNDGILGVKGADHPFPIYRAAHVPVALSTDDEGVSRIDLTHEYVRAALDYHLSYADLKQLARTGMEHNFLPGAGLWAKPDDFATPSDACKGQPLGAQKPSAACKAFLDASQKAAAQWELERRFHAFESKF